MMSIETIEKLKLIASDGVMGDSFGGSVAISGDYAIVGARGDDDKGENSGSAYIFKKDVNGNFTQTDKLTASDGAYSDSFGGSVAIDGDYVVVGAVGDDDNGNRSGSAYIFKNDGNGNFSEIAKLTASDGSSKDRFGENIAIDGKYVIISAPRNKSAYIFKNDGNGNFSEIAILRIPHVPLGLNVDISNKYAAVTTQSAVGAIPGSAYIFERDNHDNFNQIAKLDGSTSGYDAYGCDVKISGKYVIVGAMGDDAAYGSAYLYKNMGGSNFIQIDTLIPSERTEGDRFGDSVDMHNNYIVIGAGNHGLEHYHHSGNNTGAAFIFKNDGSSNFSEIAKLTASDGAAKDGLGRSVAVCSDYAIAGASRNDENGEDSGAAYIYATNSISMLSKPHWNWRARHLFVHPMDLVTHNPIRYIYSIFKKNFR